MFLLLTGSVFAQGVAIPDMPFDNFHILTPAPAQTRDWYITHLGAVAAPTAGMAHIGPTLAVFLRNATAKPSAGSAIDHVAFSTPAVEAKARELEASGATRIVVASNLAASSSRFLRDPWGVTIEILDDPATRGLHHFHLHVRGAHAAIDWYQMTIGGERRQFEQHDGLRFGAMWLLASESADVTAPSADRAIQHVAWRVADIDRARTLLLAHDVKVGEIRPYQDVRFATFESPSGGRVEIIARPQP
jgi:hypothetical protein